MDIRNCRRVVTGLNAQGKSCVIIDGAPKGVRPAMVWRSESVPADNTGSDDINLPAFTYDQMNDGSSNFLLTEYPPGTDIDFHVTNTLDYVVVMEGEVVLTLEDGEARLCAGDLLVDRGVRHGWRNDSDKKAVILVISIPAHPLYSA